VLADSERDEAGVRAMGNHAGRPEVRAALGGALGRDGRRRGTLGGEMLYPAAPLPAGGGGGGGRPPLGQVPRAVPGGAWAVGRAAGSPGVLGRAAGPGVNGRVARRVATRRPAAQRMAEGRLDPPDPVEGTDDVADLARALGDMGLNLRAKIATLETER